MELVIFCDEFSLGEIRLRRRRGVPTPVARLKRREAELQFGILDGVVGPVLM